MENSTSPPLSALARGSSEGCWVQKESGSPSAPWKAARWAQRAAPGRVCALSFCTEPLPTPCCTAGGRDAGSTQAGRGMQPGPGRPPSVVCPSSAAAAAVDPRPRRVPQPEGRVGGIAEPPQRWPCRPQLSSIPLCSAGPGCSTGLGWRDRGWESSSAAPGGSPPQNIPGPRTSSPRAQGANAGPVSPAGTSGRWARG